MDSAKRKAIQEVIAKASNVYVSSIDDNGFPNIKAMFARMQDDPDYCVYRFVAEKGNYCQGLVNVDFEICELND